LLVAPYETDDDDDSDSPVWRGVALIPLSAVGSGHRRAGGFWPASPCTVGCKGGWRRLRSPLQMTARAAASRPKPC